MGRFICRRVTRAVVPEGFRRGDTDKSPLHGGILHAYRPLASAHGCGSPVVGGSHHRVHRPSGRLRAFSAHDAHAPAGPRAGAAPAPPPPPPPPPTTTPPTTPAALTGVKTMQFTWTPTSTAT